MIENQLKKAVASRRMKGNLKQQEEGYRECVQAFLECFNSERNEIDIFIKKLLLSLIFKNIKISSAFGGVRGKRESLTHYMSRLKPTLCRVYVLGIDDKKAAQIRTKIENWLQS